ncbi:hypothetical protein SBF1_2640018 [Candidatus Desulfosporosinus infrequens]|uniref:Uncharacterized protein n=1 Tax=Candidatus Desulfosporosinus infrequens TaxID=2043169 RepID=A0A2U3KSD4_9FIRM|nr:hypothetical protein SBF1_2640018 [Candidatus Desulfosporosinus infrequens]
MPSFQVQNPEISELIAQIYPEWFLAKMFILCLLKENSLLGGA